MDGVGKAHVQFGFEIAAALGTTPRPTGTAATTEQSAEDVAETAALHVVGVEVERGSTAEASEPARPAGADARAHHLTHFVVGLALLGVAEHVVGRTHFLEAFLGRRVARVLVGVEFAGEVLVGALDLLVGCTVGHADGRVVVLFEPLTLRFHHSPPRSSSLSVVGWHDACQVPLRVTFTIAGRRTRPRSR